MRYFLFLILIIFSDDVYAKKKIKINDEYFECKSPKNSFERTRGVRTRICFFSKEDKIKINRKIRENNLIFKKKFKKR